MITLFEEMNEIHDVEYVGAASLFTETKVSIVRAFKKKELNGLIDSEASGVHFKCSVLKFIKYK